MRVAACIEYNGARFHGWQFQSGAVSVQQVVEEALSRVANEPVRIHSAGRTDAGVHALGQVVHFDTEVLRTPRSWVMGANSYLPDDVAVRWAQPVRDDFHSRFSGVSRTYRYLILNRPGRPGLLSGRVTWVSRPLDAASMHAAGQALVGTHDFSAYRALACQARSPVRTLKRLDVERRGELIELRVTANAFLHHMVRNIAGVLLAIGRGEAPTGWAREVLEGRDRTRGGVTALPDGLYFAAVHYPAAYALPEADVFDMACW